MFHHYGAWKERIEVLHIHKLEIGTKRHEERREGVFMQIQDGVDEAARQAERKGRLYQFVIYHQGYRYQT